MAKIIRFAPILDLDEPVRNKIREIRNEDGVRMNMYTSHIISEEEHRAWLARLGTDARQLVLVVMDDETNTPLGIVSANQIDRQNRKTDWAFYLGESSRNSGLGAVIEWAFIQFVFDVLGMEKLNCEVLETNDGVVKLHQKFLFQTEGFRRSNILKDGNRIGVHFLGLTKEDWVNGKDDIYQKYQNLFKKFEVKFDCNLS